MNFRIFALRSLLQSTLGRTEWDLRRGSGRSEKANSNASLAHRANWRAVHSSMLA